MCGPVLPATKDTAQNLGRFSDRSKTGYADKYRDCGKPVHLVGVEFSKARRNVVAFEPRPSPASLLCLERPIASRRLGEDDNRHLHPRLTGIATQASFALGRLTSGSPKIFYRVDSATNQAPRRELGTRAPIVDGGTPSRRQAGDGPERAQGPHVTGKWRRGIRWCTSGSQRC